MIASLTALGYILCFIGAVSIAANDVLHGFVALIFGIALIVVSLSIVKHDD